MRLSELILQAKVHPAGHASGAEISGMFADSRKVSPGSIFVCMPSPSRDTHQFLPEVAAKGAVAAVAHSEEGFRLAQSLNLAAVWAPVENHGFQELVWRLAKTFFGNPSAEMKVIGVTGTNGKTTTCWFVWQLLSQLAGRSAYLGTIGLWGEGGEIASANTTPFPVELISLLSDLRQNGVRHLAMEVSSHALAERRADGVEFDLGVFTNLTQDHLDFHGTMEAYQAAKYRLFSELPKILPSRSKPC